MSARGNRKRKKRSRHRPQQPVIKRLERRVARNNKRLAKFLDSLEDTDYFDNWNFEPGWHEQIRRSIDREKRRQKGIKGLIPPRPPGHTISRDNLAIQAKSFFPIASLSLFKSGRFEAAQKRAAIELFDIPAQTIDENTRASASYLSAIPVVLGAENGLPIRRQPHQLERASTGQATRH